MSNELPTETKTIQLPLLCAATNNDSAQLQELLDLHEDINQEDDCGQNALHWATYGASFEAAELLLKHGIHLNSSISTTLSPLFCASCKEKKNFMQLYLTYGADFNQPERDNICLLKHLIGQHATDLMQELVNYGHWHQPDLFSSYQKEDCATTIVSLKLLALNSLKTKDNHDSLMKTLDIQAHYSIMSALVEYYTHYVSFDKKLVFFRQLSTDMQIEEREHLAATLGSCHAQRYEKKWQAVKTQTSLPLAIDQSIIASNITQSFSLLLRPRPTIKNIPTTR